MILTDTHCHLDFHKFDEDRTNVIRRAENAGLVRILIPGITLNSSRAITNLIESYPILFAAIGVHPNDSLTWDNATSLALKELAINPKVVAVGEIGLDYYWDAAPSEHQKRVLREQLELATEMQLPAVLHMREAKDALEGDCSSDLLNILREWVSDLKSLNNPLAERPGVLHSFSGSLETALAAIQLGFFIGITGPVTFKNAMKRQEIISQLPLECLLIETDAPFLAPHPHRGKRNEPAYVSLVAGKIAQLHSTTEVQIAEASTANAARLFGW